MLTWRVCLSASKASSKSMARLITLPNRAIPNSAATSHHSDVGTDRWLDTTTTMPSMMSLVIQSAAIGNREATSRKTSPSETTIGPDSQTIRRTGGTLRSAERRSTQPLRKFSSSAIFAIFPSIQRGDAEMPKGLPGFQTTECMGLEDIILLARKPDHPFCYFTLKSDSRGTSFRPHRDPAEPGTRTSENRYFV